MYLGQEALHLHGALDLLHLRRFGVLDWNDTLSCPVLFLFLFHLKTIA